MPITAQRTFTVSGSWQAPPGYNGPVLVEGFSPTIGSVGVYCSGLFTASAGQAYTVDPNYGRFGGNLIGDSISANQTCSSGLTVSWWPGYATYKYMTSGSYTWQAPAGYRGPFLYHFRGYISGSLNTVDGVENGYIDGLGFGGVIPVQVGGTYETQVHTINVYTGSTCILVWWP